MVKVHFMAGPKREDVFRHMVGDFKKYSPGGLGRKDPNRKKAGEGEGEGGGEGKGEVEVEGEADGLP